MPQLRRWSTEADAIAGLFPAEYERIILNTVDSTMLEAARRAPDLTRPTWILAKSQSSGRGRQGRNWAMPNGNFAATLVLSPNCTALEAAQRSFLASNALLKALALYTPIERLKVKWPNDVLLAGGKVAGILLEAQGQGGQVDQLMIGIGVNLASVPESVEDALFRPVALTQYGEAVDSERFLIDLASNYAIQEKTFAQFGFDRIREDWLQRAARIGEVIKARTPKETIHGIFETIDASGNLVLGTPRGQKTIPAADVYF
ncbi:MAG: biotin--[acetyl-CoA-carboxylase] ligase [Pseudomonadota bacterium]